MTEFEVVTVGKVTPYWWYTNWIAFTLTAVPLPSPPCRLLFLFFFKLVIEPKIKLLIHAEFFSLSLLKYFTELTSSVVEQFYTSLYLLCIGICSQRVESTPTVSCHFPASSYNCELQICPCRGSHIEVNQDWNRLFLTLFFALLRPHKTNAVHSPASNISECGVGNQVFLSGYFAAHFVCF
jgi:hypothetical protein